MSLPMSHFVCSHCLFFHHLAALHFS
jgi:hypothetical protein